MNIQAVDIRVRPIIEKYVIQEVLSVLGTVSPAITYSTRKMGIVFVGEDHTNVVCDNECIYQILPRQLFKVGQPIEHGGPIWEYWVELPIYAKVDNGNGTHTQSMSAEFVYGYKMLDLMAICGPTVPLHEFMGSRWKYNPRITTNTTEMVSFIINNMQK